MAASIIRKCRGLPLGRKLQGRLKRLLRRRSAIEPVIGHLKQDHQLKRHYLQGKDGDDINALLAGCGFNLRKLIRVFFWLLFGHLALTSETKPPLATQPNLQRLLESTYSGTTS